ncbi:hypothetical protein NUK34_08240 [Kerstersia gyiorum]|uniref:hypothetical protein n=1 Tax=Kerstersia gyiorum TaxID=206506 RepID=UPI00214FB1BF|nr:hypothetical protein [Kerstersia gyiorum]MCR4158840.1 hypothetical protein [Kerstersia gyiorum]
MSIINLNQSVGIRQKSLTLTAQDDGGQQLLVVFDVGALSEDGTFRAIGTKNYLLPPDQAATVLAAMTNGGSVGEELQAALLAELEKRPDWVAA